MLIVERLKAHVEEALLNYDGGIASAPVLIETCRHGEFGDFSCAVAMARTQGKDSGAAELARKIALYLEQASDRRFFTVNVSMPGFINFNLTNNFLASVLVEIHKRFSETNTPSGFAESATSECYDLCSAILRCAQQPTFDLLNDTELAPVLSDVQWQECKLEYKNSIHSFDAAFDATFDDAPLLFVRQKSLILMLERSIRPRIDSDCRELADAFFRFYQSSRVFTGRLNVTKARLGLVLAVKLVLEHQFSPKI